MEGVIILIVVLAVVVYICKQPILVKSKPVYMTWHGFGHRGRQLGTQMKIFFEDKSWIVVGDDAYEGRGSYQRSEKLMEWLRNSKPTRDKVLAYLRPHRTMYYEVHEYVWDGYESHYHWNKQYGIVIDKELFENIKGEY